MDKLKFTVDSALLSELGEKLVESPHIALVELVKNAYDADATDVRILIDPNDKGGPEIQVVDDGSGMTFEDVKRYWMRIATTHKQEKNVSPRYGRPRTGKKGIGRFACRRLGTNLELVTTATSNGSYEETKVSFPWLEFVAGEELSEIECKGSHQKFLKSATGTTLIISGSPSDEWNKRGFGFLQRQLAVLAANRGARREGFEEDPGFSVHLEAPGFSGNLFNLRERLLSAGWGDVEIEVTDGGTVNYTLNAMKVGKKTAVHPDKFPDLASVEGRIGIMPTYSRDEMRDRNVVSKQSLSEIVDEWGGVFIRFKGFRVYPFGGPGNDWLNIDRDRGSRKTALSPVLQSFAANLRGVNPQRNLLLLLSSKSYIGDIDIGERAIGFEPKASREGFVGEAAVDQLREVVRFGIDWSTIYREYVNSLNLRAEAEEAREELENQLNERVASKEIVTTALRVLENEVKVLATQLPTTQRQQVLRSFRTATEAIAKHEASNREELRHLQLVASTSTLLLIFSHEVRSLLGWFEDVRISLDSIGRKIKGSEADALAKISNKFGVTKDRFIDLISMTSLISTTRKSEPARLTLLPRLEQAIRSFDLISSKYRIEIDITSVNKSLQVGPMLESELFAILLNLLSNSIKSVIAAGGERKVGLFAERKNSYVLFNISDTGIGIAEEHFEDVFSPFSSDPDNRLYPGLDSKMNAEDENIIGTGSGLGLSIAREILSNRNGTIRFIKPPKGWNANIEVIFP